jgi:hypothetical protein
MGNKRNTIISKHQASKSKTILNAKKTVKTPFFEKWKPGNRKPPRPKKSNFYFYNNVRPYLLLLFARKRAREESDSPWEMKFA